VGWSDVGAWPALWEVRPRDAAGNVLDGDIFVHDARDNRVVPVDNFMIYKDIIRLDRPD